MHRIDSEHLRAKYAGILAGPDTLGKKFLLEYLHKKVEQAPKLPETAAAGRLIPSKAGSQAPEPVDVQNLSMMMEAFDEAVEATGEDEPDLPPGYEVNDEWVGENPDEPEGDIPF